MFVQWDDLRLLQTGGNWTAVARQGVADATGLERGRDAVETGQEGEDDVVFVALNNFGGGQGGVEVVVAQELGGSARDLVVGQGGEV